MSPRSIVLPDTRVPVNGEPLAATQPSEETLRLLWSRRSASVRNLRDPGPSDVQIEQLLTIAARVPDHGKLAPWRFVLIKGDARHAFGDVLATALQRASPDATPDRLELERGRLLRAPLVVCVVSAPRAHPKIPEWEQILSAGAAAQTLLIAATAMGFGAQWITEWCAYDDTVRAALGLQNPSERVAAMIYIGTTDQPSPERERPALRSVVSDWPASAG